MLTKTPHLFDDATRITAGDSSWQGCAGDDYWAFVGQFGGATAAAILRALIDHPQRAGDPLSRKPDSTPTLNDAARPTNLPPPPRTLQTSPAPQR